MKQQSIWHTTFTLDELTGLSAETMIDHLGIEYSEFGDDYLKARMPVDHRTKQPAGLLHGGASAALAETLGSICSYLCIDRTKYSAVGIGLDIHHLRPATGGTVTGTARPVRLGRRTHVWEIRIRNEADKLVSTATLTMAILPVPDSRERKRDEPERRV
jgi:1,4-dihydroxy-2-naphthoyl-CoA hydrolase